MERLLLPSAHVAEPVRQQISSFHRDTVEEVVAAVGRHAVVVVGMKQNPVVKKARRLLDDAGVNYHYLEYGSYLSQWKRRLAIKLWAGFPTFPMVFVDGTLVGGAAEVEKLKTDGKLKRG